MSKQCRRCLAHLAPEKFSKDKGKPDGLMVICKRCDVERKYDTLKTCRLCLRELPTSQFHRKAEASDGLQDICRACKGGENQKRSKPLSAMEGFIPLAQAWCLRPAP